MNKSIQKLIFLLRETYNELTEIIKRSYFNQPSEDKEKSLVTCHFAGNLGLWLSQDEEFRKKHKLIFDEFTVLSYILEAPEFNRKDIFNILTHIIKLNIDQSLLDDEMQISTREIDSSKYIETLTTPESLRGYADDETYYDTYVKIQKIRYEHEEPSEKLYQGVFNKELVELSNLKKQHAIINEKYFKKIDTYELEDVDNITQALIDLGISAYCVQTIKELLIFKIEKRNRKIEEPKTNIIKTHVFQEKLQSYNRRQYKIIMKDLSSYYDFELKTPIRTLSYSEMVYVLAQLKKLDWSKENLEMLLAKMDKFNLQHDPTLHCQNLLVRLGNYSLTAHDTSDLKDVTNATKALEEYLLELQSCNTLEEQQEWQDVMKEELNHAYSLVPKIV